MPHDEIIFRCSYNLIRIQCDCDWFDVDVFTYKGKQFEQHKTNLTQYTYHLRVFQVCYIEKDHISRRVHLFQMVSPERNSHHNRLLLTTQIPNEYGTKMLKASVQNIVKFKKYSWRGELVAYLKENRNN